MTEMEFLKVFNDIEDKFVDKEIEGETEPLTPVTVNPNGAKNRFFWVKFAGIAAACAAVVGGLTYLKNNPNIAVNPSVTEGESSVQTAAPDFNYNLILYQTKLNCNNVSYDVRVFLTEIDEEESLNDEKYIWGNAAMELSLNGEILDTMEIYENSYSTSAYGTPFDKETLGSDYFRVISMEQDVLAFISPNAAMHNVVLDNNYDALLNARFFTVNKEGKIAPIERYATEEEKKEIDTGAEAWIEPAYLFFKITPDYDIKENRLICHLDRQVMNPWWVNGTLYEKGDIPLSFDFENYTLTCENDDYKYLIYNAEGIYDSLSDNITLLDGSFAKEGEVKKTYSTSTPGRLQFISGDFAFAVPSFTPIEKRAPWRAGDWIKLTAGDTIGDFTVVRAESSYLYPSGLYYPVSYVAKVELEGDLSCTGTAKRTANPAGMYDNYIAITLDDESCEKLFDMSFKKYGFDKRLCVFIYADESYNDAYQALYVQNRESVKVKLKANSFIMRYCYETGNSFDGCPTLLLNDSDYSIELAEEEKAVTETDELNEKIYNAVASAETVEELTRNLSPYSDSFNRFAVYSYYDPINSAHSLIVKSGKLKNEMLCVIYYDEGEDNIRQIPIFKPEEPNEEITLMDGSAAADDEILSEDDKTFTVNSCFAVPFSTVNGNRQAWRKGEWIKLKKGNTFGDYTVQFAESTYTKPSEGVLFPPYKSKVILSGKLSCTGTAKIIPSQTGYDGLVELTLDEDSCQKLMNLAPYLDSDFLDSPSQDRIYMWLTYKDKDYQPIIDELQNTESVRVKLETEHFSLSYQYGSEYWYDGKVMLNSVGNEHSLEIISE